MSKTVTVFKGKFMRNFSTLLFAVLLAGFLAAPSLVFAQADGGGGGAAGGAGAGGAAGGAGTGGIEIDASGVLRANINRDVSGKLDRDLVRAAKASLNQDLQNPSSMRMVSLRRLQQAVQAAHAAGRPLEDDIRFLAGLTRITHVFYLPEHQDIILAGPAEGFYLNGRGRVVGLETGAATMHFEDLVVALRAFAPNQRPTPVISVSIDPTAQGIRDYNQAFAHWGQLALTNQADDATVRNGLITAMGLQEVTLKGVSNKTRAALVLTEADYRMKLIGLGLETPAVRINNYFDQMPMTPGNSNASIRWFFQPKYNGVFVNSSETALRLDTANTVELVPAEDRLDAAGRKVEVKEKSNKASRNFCYSFTKEFDRLAAKDSLFGELRNLVDLTVAAAFIQRMDLYGKAGLSLGVLGDESAVPTQRYNAPTHIEPVVNIARRNGAFSAPIAGGVNIQPQAAFVSESLQTEEISVDELQGQAKLSNLADGQWWWDAESPAIQKESKKGK
jgi:hypothetical protein